MVTQDSRYAGFMTQSPHQSQDFYKLRAATEGDARVIQKLIRSARINPFGLDWHRFVVACTSDGEVIGSGQIKPHADGSLELASIAVKRGWRRRGVARALILQLMATHPGPLYLTCRGRLGKFYSKFGFHKLEQEDIPAYFQRIRRISDWLKAFGLLREELWVMRAEN